MEKKLVIIGCFCLISYMSIYSQGLIGKYTNEQDYLNFKPNNTIEFAINSGGGITVDYIGSGNFKYVNGFLKIELKKSSLTSNLIKLAPNSASDNVTIKVSSADYSKPLTGFVKIRLIKNQINISKQVLIGGSVRIPKKEFEGSKEIQLIYGNYNVISYTLPKSLTEDLMIELFGFPDFEITQKFLNDEGQGLCIKVDRDTLFLRRRTNSYVDIDIDSLARSAIKKEYEWRKFLKKK